MSEYCTGANSSGWREKVKLDLSNYAAKIDLRNAAGVDASFFAKKVV